MQFVELMGCTGDCRRDAGIFLSRTATCAAQSSEAACVAKVASCDSPGSGAAGVLGLTPLSGVCAAMVAAVVLVA